MRKVFNFGAGPAMLPEEVLLEAQREMLDWKGTGISIMEWGHREPEFIALAEQTVKDLRELMAIPEHYEILFFSGGATNHFAMVPLNLLGQKKSADYVDTGIWSKKAIQEAKRYTDVNIAAELLIDHSLVHIPPQNQWKLNPKSAYVHYTPNETIEGVAFHWVPETGPIPLVADMTSMILSEPIDVTKFGIIYAGAQKNLGQAGISIGIIRSDLIQPALAGTPTLYHYRTQAENKSLYNTPPTFAWYILSLVLKWTKDQGGVEALAKVNRRKAQKLYSFIDEHHEFYRNNVMPECRSLMNVPFNLKNPDLTSTFLHEAAEIGLTKLRGHRLAGGVRASIYNAMPESGVDKLIEFMQDFVKRHG